MNPLGFLGVRRIGLVSSAIIPTERLTSITVPSAIACFARSQEYLIESICRIVLKAKLVVPGKYFIPVLAWVKLRKQDASGNPIGEEHTNLILDTRVYELEFPDGGFYEYAVNIIIDQVDDQGWDTGIL